MPQAIKARADIEVSCYGYEGIDAVKSALQAGMSVSNDCQQVKINLITPPQYVLTTQSLDKESGLGMLQQSIDLIEKSIKAQGGGFNVIQAVSIGLDSLFVLCICVCFCVLLRSARPTRVASQLSAKISSWISIFDRSDIALAFLLQIQHGRALRGALFFSDF